MSEPTDPTSNLSILCLSTATADQAGPSEQRIVITEQMTSDRDYCKRYEPVTCIERGTSKVGVSL